MKNGGNNNNIFSQIVLICLILAAILLVVGYGFRGLHNVGTVATATDVMQAQTEIFATITTLVLALAGLGTWLLAKMEFRRHVEKELSQKILEVDEEFEKLKSSLSDQHHFSLGFAFESTALLMDSRAATLTINKRDWFATLDYIRSAKHFIKGGRLTIGKTSLETAKLVLDQISNSVDKDTEYTILKALLDIETDNEEIKTLISNISDKIKEKMLLPGETQPDKKS